MLRHLIIVLRYLIIYRAEASHYRAAVSHYRAEVSHRRAEASHDRPLDDVKAYSHYLDWLSLKNKAVHWLPPVLGDALIGYMYAYCCPGIKRYTLLHLNF